MDYFLSFDKVIVYYENGQSPVTVLIGTVCGSDFFDVDYRNVIPSDYRLFQSADLLCTLELAGIKADAGKLSRSEGYSSKSGESSRRTTWTSLKS